MNDQMLTQRRRMFPWLACTVLTASTAAALAVLASATRGQETQARATGEATSESVHQMCGACHAYPPPDTFPRSAWRKEVKQGFDFFHQDATLQFAYPSLESVVRYYENRAPDELESPARPRIGKCPIHFETQPVPASQTTSSPGVAHVSLVHLFRKDKLDILVCDASNKQILVLSLYEPAPAWKVIAKGLSCAHAEVVDLNGDGINDVVLACLGNFYATDDRVGSVVWLKGMADHSFEPHVLLDGVGRVADVRAANFTGTGKLDLVVAEFGWHQTGGILLLENQTTDWSKPLFKPRVIDNRHGTTHVPVADLNGDGKPDFVALITQEHETVVAFLNEGGGRFRKETIYTAPHPSFGCQGIQLVDLDGDGDLDVLLANGDVLDAPYILKPYHGLTWLENRGSYPFEAHRLADCPGAGSPVTADFNGDGRLDIAVVTFLPADLFPTRQSAKLDSVLLLVQAEKGKFVRYSVETGACDHLSCAAGDLTGSGLPDLVIGNFVNAGQPAPEVTLLRNITSTLKPSAPPKP
jgi:cytochrome c5